MGLDCHLFSTRPYHEEVMRIYQDLHQRHIPIYTSDYVLDEAITFLFKRGVFQNVVRFVEGVKESAALGHIHLEEVTPDRFNAAWELRKRFYDKPSISFTDLTSMVIMEERGIPQVLTEDAHFIQMGMGFIKIP